MRIRKSMFTGLAMLGILAGGLLLSSAPALGLTAYLKEEIGRGTLLVTPTDKYGVAVNDVTGETYVTSEAFSYEYGLFVFGPSGNHLTTFSQEFNLSIAPVAVDNSAGLSDGDIYIANRSSAVVYRRGSSDSPVDFTASESYVSGSQITGTPSEPFVYGSLEDVAVDSKGDVYVLNDGVVDVYKATGEYERQITGAGTPAGSIEPVLPETSGGGGLNEVAVDGAGKVYVTDSAHGVVDVFNAKDEYERQFTGTPSGPLGVPNGVAVDSNGNVYVGDEDNGVVDVFNAKGEYERDLTGSNTAAGSFLGLADLTVDSANDLYVGDSDNGVIDVFYPAPVILPDVSTGAASHEQATTAFVTGVVNPDGIAATCTVEYGPTESFGQTVPCNPGSLGSGTNNVSVTAEVTGLKLNTSYDYRVAGTNTNGSNYGTVAKFTTLPDKPSIVSESGVSLSPREASFNGVVNPETGPTTYHFAYGPTSAYGQRIPSADLSVGTGEAPIPVYGFSVGGLHPGTTYHYTVVATNAAGTTYGPDQTFTTPVGPPPTVGTGGASAVSQQAASVSGVVDPEGVPTTYEFDLGTDTSYGTRVFGSAGSGAEAEPFTASFQTLLPGTTYHYRLLATNTYGTTYGTDQTFTTPGFPSALPGAPTALALVAIPNVAFPSEAGTTTTPTKKALTNAQKLAAALKVCKKEAKKKQAACVKQARKRYAPAKQRKSK